MVSPLKGWAVLDGLSTCFFLGVVAWHARDGGRFVLVAGPVGSRPFQRCFRSQGHVLLCILDGSCGCTEVVLGDAFRCDLSAGPPIAPSSKWSCQAVVLVAGAEWALLVLDLVCRQW